MDLSATHTATPTGWSFPKIVCLKVKFQYFSFAQCSFSVCYHCLIICCNHNFSLEKWHVCGNMHKHIHTTRLLIITLCTYMQMFTVNKPSLLVYLKIKTLSKYKVSNLLAHIQCLVIQNVASYCSIF